MYMKRLLSCFLLICLLENAFAIHLSFSNLSMYEGLSYNTVTSICQDSRGFMWIGTQNGLNLYNGTEFRVYRYEKENPNSLPDNLIKKICSDGKEKVYCLTKSGITSFDIRKCKFERVVQANISTMAFNDGLYYATENNVYKDKNVVCSIPGYAVISDIYSRNDSLLIGTEKGLYIFDLSSGKMSNPVKKGHIFSIYRDSEGVYWLPCYDGRGVYVLDGKEIRQITSSSTGGSLSSDQCHTVCEDDNGNVWIGTFNGLNCYDRKSDSFTAYYKREGKKQLTDDSVWELYKDRQGTVWAGTYYAGVYTFNPTKQLFSEYNATVSERFGLSSPTVGEFEEDGNGNLWICTEGGGLCRLDQSASTFKWYRHENGANSLSHNNVKAVCYDEKRDAMWIGTHLGGLNRLNLKTECFTAYRHNAAIPGSIPSDIVMDITRLGDNLLLSTYGGVTVFDPERETFKPLFADNKDYFSQTAYSKQVMTDHAGNIWIVNVNGKLLHYDTSTRIMTVFFPRKEKNCSVNALFEDDRHRLWICTNEIGIVLYNFEAHRFEYFDKGDGLIDNSVYGIRSLADDRYIVTTNAGFSLFDYGKKAFVNFRSNKECPLSSMSVNSLYCTKGGDVFIGGMDGMCSFPRQKLEENVSSQYEIYPYRLTVNGKTVSAEGHDGILTEDLTFARRVTLDAGCDIFSVEYATNNFLPFEQEEVMSRLKGFSDEWSEVQNHMVTYSNLPQGIYTLEFRPKHGTGPVSSMKIEILPPFYLTPWAWIGYILAVAGIVYYLMRVYRNRISLQSRLEYEQKRINDVEELSKAKQRFFINVANEFRTPLTIIMTQFDIIMQSPQMPAALHASLSKVYKSCVQLKDLFAELLDFRKHEQGKMEIHASEQNIVAFLYDNFKNFKELAERKHIAYSFMKTSDEINVWFDGKLMWKVMNNLISNALKHTSEKGRIIVSVYRRGDEVLIEVKDNGEGIPDGSISRIFDRFYRIERNDGRINVGTGIGLSLTKGIVELHHGTIDVYSDPDTETIFTIRLKTGNAHFNEEELVDVPSGVIGTPDKPADFIEDGDNDMDDTYTGGNSDKEFTVLIIEEKELSSTLKNLLGQYYNVYAATNGKDGKKMARDFSPDLIVLDEILPDTSGFDLCREIKEDTDTCHIPVILLTQSATFEKTIEGLQAEADGCMERPFHVKMLLSKCNNLIKSRVKIKEKYGSMEHVSHFEVTNNLLDQQFIDQVIRLIKDNLSDTEFNVEVLVDKMGMARTKLFRQLKRITGQTPNDYIMTVRLKEAAWLLKSCPQYNITEISEKVGFSTPQYFRKCFKDKYHISPLEYRKEDIKQP